VRGELVLAAQPLPHAAEDVARYCGIPWRDGRHGMPEPAEVWAFLYYDCLPERRSDDLLRSAEVLSTMAMHPGFRRGDLDYYWRMRDEIGSLLRRLPPEMDLGDAPTEAVDLIVEVPMRLEGATGLSLLSKVLHAKRPRLVPILDRALTDWYRRFARSKGEAAWADCVRALHADLAEAGNRAVLRELQAELRAALPPAMAVPSELRLADIAVWMASHAGGHGRRTPGNGAPS
jgi:hypothetical protein